MQQCVKTRPPLAAVLAEVLHPHLMRQWLATLPEDTVFYWSSGARDGYESVTEYIRYAAPEIDEIMLLMALRDAAFPGSPPVIVLTWRSLVDADTRPIQIRKTKELGAKILADNCGKSVDQIMKDFDRDYWMDAEEAVKYGIVDAVLSKI